MIDFLGLGAKLKAINDRLNATWAALLDAVAAKIDVTLSTRAPAATALTTATWTNGRAANLDNLDMLLSAYSPVKSIQQISSGIADGEISKTININAVTFAKTFLIPTSFTGGGYGFANSHDFYWYLNPNGTQITYYRSNTAGNFAATCFVVELK